MNKLSSFQSYVYSSSLSIVAITETWLTSHILDHELLPAGYTIFRTDRSSLGGGVMLATHISIPTRKLSSPPNLEVVTVELKLKIPITLCLVYNPPRSDFSYYSNLFSYLDVLLSSQNKVILCGDFNFPDIDWDTLSGSSISSTVFCDLVYKYNLSQLISHPTHIQGNILDLILTNDTNFVHNISISNSNSCPPTSDHYKISFHISASTPPKPKSKTHYILNYSKADWSGLAQYLFDFDFSHLYNISNLNSLWCQLKQIIHDSAILFIPKIKVRSSHNPVWFTPTIRHHLHIIHSLRKTCRKRPTPSNNSKLASAESRLQTLMTQAKSDFENHLITSFAHNNSNKIYSYIRSLSRHSSFPPVMYLDSTSASVDLEKAELFNQFFHSVFSTTTFTLPQISHLPIHSNTLEEIDISESDILEALNSLDPSKAQGPDELGPSLLKHCSYALCAPLLHLFSQCLQQHNIPSEWKLHSITPIYKSGDKTSIKNYRPISLLSCTSKILERIIYNKIIDHILTSSTSEQFGFLPNRSSTQQLLLFLNHISSQSCTDIIYLDFQKAFDKVSHPELLLKLWSIGITGGLWKWFRSYLSSRYQFVSIMGHQSHPLPVLSGVPQGSILGPLLFAIYINDLPLSVLSSRVLLFADDTKCFKSIKAPSDTSHLQNDIDAIYTWGKLWKMHFNETKCVHVRFLPSFGPSPPPTYYINLTAITSSDQHKDLGIIFSSDLSFSNHYHHISSKANKTLGIIRRAFKTSSIPAKKKLYLSLVRSQLTYCSPVWHPHLLKDIVALELIQRRATKYITGNFSTDYKSRLSSLHILPLMYYLELNDVMFLVNSIKYPSPGFNILDSISFTSSSTRSSTFHKLRHTKSSTNSVRNLYFNRIPRLWNALPPIDLSSSSHSIKSNLTKFLWTHFNTHFDPSNPCSLHFLCPCSKCTHTSQSTNFNPQTG